MQVITAKIEEEKGYELMSQVEQKITNLLSFQGTDNLSAQEKEDCEYNLEAMKECAEEKLASSFLQPLSPPGAYELGDNGFSVLYEKSGQVYISFLDL